jgi:alcohol dehydrogenase (cytochrome c)
VTRKSKTPSALLVNRGFAYMNGRLFRGTSDAHVLALDPADGRQIWDRALEQGVPGVSIPMAPIAANGLVFVGHAGGDQVGVIGHVYALSASDGRVVWTFAVVPKDGPARSTWTNKSLPITGGGFWTSFTYDEANGVLYVPAGNPAPDLDSEWRTGDNLYTNSVIALDAATGRMLAYNQIVERDSHDWDVSSAPALATTRSGRKVVASANKDGLLSVLDRTLIVRGAAVPPAIAGHALPVLWQAPTTTRENVDVPLSSTARVRFCPGLLGGVEWNGAAYSSADNAFFVGAVDWCGTVQLSAKRTIPPAGAPWFGTDMTAQQILDPPDKARGWLTSFDAETGVVRWKNQTPQPILAGVTPTAGGLVFTADLGGNVYAVDSESGKILWQMATGQSIGGGIVTYLAGGRQLVGIASGMKSPAWPGGANQSRILVYGLGSNSRP